MVKLNLNFVDFKVEYKAIINKQMGGSGAKPPKFDNKFLKILKIRKVSTESP